VAGEGGVGDYLLQYFYTLYVTRFRGEGASEKYSSAAKFFSRLLSRKRFCIAFYDSYSFYAVSYISTVQ
jgi:hypothetical protein